MCGFVGYYCFNGTRLENKNILLHGVDAISHRGPDASGVWQDGLCGLAANRLAIQDLSAAGDQPMMTSDGRYRIVFNGEIYNFRELRRELERAGTQFRSRTDTEVVLHYLSLYGVEAVGKLDGMFALACFDSHKRSLTLVRDRFGVKPLYTYKFGKYLLFGSEVKSFIPFVCHLNLPWELNHSSLMEYTLFRYNGGTKTLINNLSRVGCGSVEIYGDNGELNSFEYYSLNIGDTVAKQDLTSLGAEETVHTIFRNSIKKRLISDAPLGVALSGGVDSSLILAVASELSSKSIDTYSITLPGHQDESSYQEFVAKRFNTNHHPIPIDVSTFPQHLAKCVWLNDEPLFDPQAIPLFLLSQHASQEVKVLLGGEGADEVFAGYEYPKHLCYYSSTRKLHSLIHRYTRVSDIKNIFNPLSLDLNFRNSLLRGDTRDINNHIRFLIYTFLQPLNNRLDKMSMGSGLEFREPFLDHELVEASIALPQNMKVVGKATKVVLKKISENYYPKSHIYRPKVGFSLPLNSWLRNRKYFGQYVDILSEERFLSREFINRKEMVEFLRRFNTEDDSFEYSMGGRVWILLNLELFIRMFIEDKKMLTI